ncbi:MAG: hypothetical protein ACXADU_00970 [Promethearchaeota archaeon]|jgi:predicted ArsR family transcriptional regulator
MANKTSLNQYTEAKDFLSPIQSNLLKTLEVTGPLTRKDLVNQLKTPRTTIYDNLVQLQKRKLIEKFTRSNGKRGRPLVFWKVKI